MSRRNFAPVRSGICSWQMGERWSYYFDQLAASLRWIRVSFRPPISLVQFFFHRLPPASIFRGSNAGVQSCNRSAISQSLRVPEIRFQMH